KAKEEAERVAREKAAAEKQAREEAAAKAAAEQKAREEAAAKAAAEQKAKEEAERKRKAEEQRKAEERRLAAQKAREDMLANAMAAEEEALQRQRDAADKETYTGRLAEAIRKNWVRPAGAPPNFSCKVRIQQSPYGDVLNRSIVQSCGNDFLDNSVLDAVDRASPLPLPRNPRVFEAEAIITFVPL
ncbi:MAG: cell envelope integrity protein TolA, partial [Oceanococcaceae bacterium]